MGLVSLVPSRAIHFSYNFLRIRWHDSLTSLTESGFWVPPESALGDSNAFPHHLLQNWKSHSTVWISPWYPFTYPEQRISESSLDLLLATRDQRVNTTYASKMANGIITQITLCYQLAKKPLHNSLNGPSTTAVAEPTTFLWWVQLRGSQRRQLQGSDLVSAHNPAHNFHQPL